ncbi:MAG: M14 family metallopeptidase [Flavobacteriaceae bacterium]|nr:M14 family metallopeptidase [Flavobacteriaceae bacterium]
MGCASAPEVLFKDRVDTETKSISYQQKRTFIFAESGVSFSNQFEGARLNAVDQLNDSTYIVFIQPENEPINHSPFYAFNVWSSSAKEITLKFKYPGKYKHRYIPKIKSNGVWSVADSLNFQYDENFSSLKLQINAIAKTVSGQELHTSSIVYSWVDQLIEGKESFVRSKTIGKTRLKRPFRVLDIYKGTAKNKPVLVLLTRQHPPEVTGYFAFQAFLSTILEENKLSTSFLEHYRILAFPLMNPDGVDLGHWRHNAGGVDTNRDWSFYHQPEIKITVDYITQVLKKNNSKLVLGLDFHSTWYDVFYTNKERESTSFPEFLPKWFSSLEHHIPDYKVNEQSSNSTKPVSKGWFLYGHNAVGVTYEIGDDTPRDRIQLIGEESAKAMMRILEE